MIFFRCIWVDMTLDWVILYWCACGADWRSVARARADKSFSGLLGRCTVTRLPNFLGWVDLLSYGAPHSGAWSSAIMVSQNLEYCSRKVTHFLKYPTTVISFHGQIVPSQITLINSQIAPQNSLFVPQKSQFVPHTAISRKVVGKSARDNPERYCGWFLVDCFSNKFQRTYVCKC